ncbi:Hypothetical predicted protein [Paramuricea clavata]|uniref:Uncharacterized protein n=1 Tax=Paramuricea clavata TaxID=317549 RepID=A0A6S7JF21_PARCT|nr:Hypothetical predicted protein [Paramuricea clavata]
MLLFNINAQLKNGYCGQFVGVQTEDDGNDQLLIDFLRVGVVPLDRKTWYRYDSNVCQDLTEYFESNITDRNEVSLEDVLLCPIQSCLVCPICEKAIRRSQANAQCSICDLYVHLSCLGAEFEQSKRCSLCCNTIPPNNTDESPFALFPEFVDVVKTQGLKIVHQNIQSITKKINELQLICSSVQSGIHFITLSETLLNRQILDSEISIEGYKVFRLDRVNKGSGVAVYAKNELSVVRRDDLEMDWVEGLWVELFLPKSRRILLGMFYRTPNSSRYFDKEFVSKFEVMLDIATAEEKEVILLDDFNFDFLPSVPKTDACNRLNLLFKLLNFKQCITDATPIAERSTSLFDLIATNIPNNLSRS